LGLFCFLVSTFKSQKVAQVLPVLIFSQLPFHRTIKLKTGELPAPLHYFLRPNFLGWQHFFFYFPTSSNSVKGPALWFFWLLRLNIIKHPKTLLLDLPAARFFFGGLMFDTSFKM